MELPGQSPPGDNASPLLDVNKLLPINQAVIRKCDSADGVTDGAINDPRRCHFKLQSLQCTHGDGADCLTAAQVTAAEKIYRGPRDELIATHFDNAGGASRTIAFQRPLCGYPKVARYNGGPASSAGSLSCVLPELAAAGSYRRDVY